MAIEPAPTKKEVEPIKAAVRNALGKHPEALAEFNRSVKAVMKKALSQKMTVSQ